MSRFRRWAAILLPFVILARLILLMFQLRSEHREEAEAKRPPAWPPVVGEVLRFRRQNPGLEAWAGKPTLRPIVALVTEKDFEIQPADTACLLDPGIMGRTGGRLTLRARTAAGNWRADWDGHRTVRTRDEIEVPDTDLALRAAEVAVMEGADCGGTATLELSEGGVRALVDALEGRLPTGNVPPPKAGLNIHAILPEALRPQEPR